tara:strand:+ start:343 stop:519 length:177 start_codon:yes stop_codon:yes gene_type:complete
MSNIHNERIQEQILEDLDSISLHDFQELLTKHGYDDVNNAIDEGVRNLIQILFQERCE